MLFGSKEKTIQRLIKKGKWEALRKFLNSDPETRLILAKECGKSNDPGVNSVLTTLLRDEDEKVQLEAVKSITVTGRDHEVAQLQWLMSNTPEDKTELISAIQNAIASVRGRR
jgi:hypothetical protein